MSNTISLLITLSNGEYLIRAAIKLPSDALDNDCRTYCLEPENKATIAGFLPIHVRSFGAIVEVEEIFDIEDKTV